MKRLSILGAAAAALSLCAAGNFAFGQTTTTTTTAPAPAAGAAPAAAARPQVKDTRSADPALAKSGTYMSEANHARITWSVTHNGFSTFSAVLPYFDAKLTLDAANPANSKLDVSVPMGQSSTGVPEAAFDGTLKGERLFNVAKFPNATFKATKIERTAPNMAKVTGDLSFLGVTKPAVLNVTFNQAGEGPGPGYKIGFTGTMNFKRSDWGLMTLLPGVSDEVSLNIEAEFVPPKPAP